MDKHLILIMFSLTYWKSYAYICGSDHYEDEVEICCNNQVLPRWDRETGEEVDCCHICERKFLTTFWSRLPRPVRGTGIPLAELNTTYNPLSKICCGHHLLDKWVGDQEQLCCGEKVYTEDQGFCCDDRYYEHDHHPGKIMDCCGRRQFDLNLQFCCVNDDESKVYFLNRSIMSPACCQLQFFDEATAYCDWETGQILDFNQEWCGSEIIDIDKKICCDGQIKDLPANTKMPNLYSCCGPLVMKSNSNGCCKTGAGDYRLIPARHKCCGNSDYDPDTHECCSNTVVKRPDWPHSCCGTDLISLLYSSSDSCCNGQKINKHNQKCCGKKVIESSRECCGADELTPDSVCCKHLALPDIMIKKAMVTDTKCCRMDNGSNIPYNHHTQNCSTMDGISSKVKPPMTLSISKILPVVTSTTHAKATLAKLFPIYNAPVPKRSLRTETSQRMTACPACEDANITNKQILSSACGKKHMSFELKKIMKVRNGKVTAGVRNKSRKQRRSRRHLKRRNLKLSLPSSCSCLKVNQQYQLYTNRNIGNRKIVFIKDDDLILPKDKRIRKTIKKLCKR